jgi:hypothetical protein
MEMDLKEKWHVYYPLGCCNEERAWQSFETIEEAFKFIRSEITTSCFHNHEFCLTNDRQVVYNKNKIAELTILKKNKLATYTDQLIQEAREDIVKELQLRLKKLDEYVQDDEKATT